LPSSRSIRHVSERSVVKHCLGCLEESLTKLDCVEIHASNDEDSTKQDYGAAEVPDERSQEILFSMIDKKHQERFSNFSDDVGYPSAKLLARLDCHCDKLPIRLRRTSELNALSSLSGLELVNYFHMVVAAVSPESADEQLHHVLWTSVVLYSSPLHEIPSVVFLSTRAVYFVSDDTTVRPLTAAPVKYHARHSSDEIQRVKIKLKSSAIRRTRDLASSEGSMHLSCGLLSEVSPRRDHRPARVYATVALKNLRQVHVGLFDQTFRMTSADDQVLACLTRDHRSTEEFVSRLNEILATSSQNTNAAAEPPEARASEAPDQTAPADAEPDFYRTFTRYRRQESGDCRHAKHVRICYPPDESVADVSFLVRSALRGRKLNASELKIHFYLLCFLVEAANSAGSERR
jgi:hypothetical protein